MSSTQGIYSLAKLREACSKGLRFNFVFFLNYNDKDLELDPVTKGCLSQFFPSNFHDKEGHKFTSCIQYMMSQKAVLFNDRESLRAIMNSEDQNKMKQIGRGI